MKSGRIQFWLGIGVSLVLLVWMFQQVDWSEVRSSLAEFEFWVLIPSFLTFVLHFVIRAYRWRYLLPDNSERKRGLLFDSMMIGNLATFLLPLRAGEFIRPFVLSQKSLHSFAVSFVSVVLERFFDLSAVLATFLVVVWLLDGSQEGINPLFFDAAVVLMTGALGILGFIVASTLFPTMIKAFLNKVFSLFPDSLSKKPQEMLSDFIEGAEVLKGRGRLPMVVFLTGLVWGSAFLRTYVILMGFEGVPLSSGLAVTVTIFVSLAIALPSAPGFVGPYQLGVVGGFLLFGLAQDEAIAFAIISHSFEYLFICGMGVFSLLRNGFSFRDISRKPQKI